MMTIQFDQFGETVSRDTDGAVDLAAGAVGAQEFGVIRDGLAGPTLPTRRRQRSRNTRRPPSGLVAAAPVMAGSAGCDVDAATHDTQPYRMGRWARLAITITVVSTVIVIALSVVLSDTTVSTGSLTVAAGDTLWTIAERIAPDENAWSVIDEITALNGLTTNVIVPGQVLVVPVA